VYFAPVDRDRFIGFNANADARPIDRNNRYGYSAVDDDAFFGFSRQDEHGQSSMKRADNESYSR
jgi:hypothetical protein